MQSKKAFLLIAGILFLVFSLGIEVRAEPFRVAVILPSTIGDLAFSQSMYDSLVAVQKEMGPKNFQFSYSEKLYVLADAGVALRDYATKGYDLVIAHGAQYGSVLAEIAPDFPKVSFAWGNSRDNFSSKGVKNVFAFEIHAEQGGYLNGVLAAKITRKGIIGVIGPMNAGDCKMYVSGFKAGVLATNPKATVNITWTGSFSDIALASEAAQTHINAGADILTGAAQIQAGAVGVARQRGVYWLASQADQTSLAPEIVVASAIYEWRPLLRTLVKEIKGGTRGEKVFTLDYSNDSIRMIINGSVLEKALRGKAEKGTEEALLGKTEKDMKEGKIKINIE